jgi:hypothetical protein
MSLTWMRRWSRLIAVVLLFAAARLPHLDADDVACVAWPTQADGAHDETKHGLRTATSEDGDHCAVCHWTRTLRSPGPDITVVLAHVALPSLLPASADGIVSASFVRNLPARAPPSALL